MRGYPCPRTHPPRTLSSTSLHASHRNPLYPLYRILNNRFKHSTALVWSGSSTYRFKSCCVLSVAQPGERGRSTDAQETVDMSEDRNSPRLVPAHRRVQLVSAKPSRESGNPPGVAASQRCSLILLHRERTHCSPSWTYAPSSQLHGFPRRAARPSAPHILYSPQSFWRPHYRLASSNTQQSRFAPQFPSNCPARLAIPQGSF